MTTATAEPEPIALCWSGGKDSALALAELHRDPRFRVALLVTTVTAEFDRVCMHGVRRSLLRRQAESVGLPLKEVFVPPWPSNSAYEDAMGAAFREILASGIRRIAFGDIFLADLKAYRDALLASLGLSGVYPLWNRNTRELVGEFIAAGFRAITVCVNPQALDETFVGYDIDADLVARLPAGVDPCGENGEYHSFVYDGPGWSVPVPFRKGETVSRDAFLFCDLLPEHADSSVSVTGV